MTVEWLRVEPTTSQSCVQHHTALQGLLMQPINVLTWLRQSVWSQHSWRNITVLLINRNKTMCFALLQWDFMNILFLSLCTKQYGCMNIFFSVNLSTNSLDVVRMFHAACMWQSLSPCHNYSATMPHRHGTLTNNKCWTSTASPSTTTHSNNTTLASCLSYARTLPAHPYNM